MYVCSFKNLFADLYDFLCIMFTMLTGGGEIFDRTLTGISRHSNKTMYVYNKACFNFVLNLFTVFLQDLLHSVVLCILEFFTIFTIN